MKMKSKDTHTQLEDMRQACDRLKKENQEQIHTRLEDMRYQACEQVKNEN